MTDVLTTEQRRRNMASIRDRDTRPEMVVRSMIHGMGYRYRLHRKGLPGKPDIVFPRLRKVIFVHGCFWHMHDCRYGKVTPATNSDFWHKKRTGNVERDRKNIAALKAQGREVLVLWECWTRDPKMIARQIADFLPPRRYSCKTPVPAPFAAKR
ncbi:MAG: DNA mismatch endonuclease Vsr [Clostridiaceae bacterium]|nr:DNA mismatch endonuclease Vsr [Clostridiaceae bacterium]